MTLPGKLEPGLKGFPTPDEVPEEVGYLVFRFPNSNDWAGLLLGALDALSKEYNWYQWGELTPAEAAEAFKDIVTQAPYDTCGCTLPGGSKVIRIGINGKFEELGESGEWQEPTGDYEIPPVTPREGGSPQNQMCLASANAASVLEQLYEQTVDMIADGLSILDIVAGVITGIGALIAGAIGLAAGAIITIVSIAFREFVEAATFLGADVWDSTFSDALQCMLYACADNDAGVVTFDWDCFVERLWDNTNPFLLDAQQLRLLGQVGYLLNIISIDGLNLAGATTAITEADCSDCNRDWCYAIDLELTDGSEFGVTISGGVWTVGVGIVGIDGGTHNKSNTWGYWTFPEELNTYQVGTNYLLPAASGDNARSGIWALKPIVNYREDFLAENFGIAGEGILGNYIDENLALDGMGWDLNSGDEAVTAVLKKLIVRYRRSEPIWEPNCEDV